MKPFLFGPLVSLFIAVPVGAIDVDVVAPANPLASLEEPPDLSEVGVAESQIRLAIGAAVGVDGAALTLRSLSEAVVDPFLGVRLTGEVGVASAAVRTSTSAVETNAALRLGPALHLFPNQFIDVAFFAEAGIFVAVAPEQVWASPELVVGSAVSLALNPHWFVQGELTGLWLREPTSVHRLGGSVFVAVGVVL